LCHEKYIFTSYNKLNEIGECIYNIFISYKHNINSLHKILSLSLVKVNSLYTKKYILIYQNQVKLHECLQV